MSSLHKLERNTNGSPSIYRRLRFDNNTNCITNDFVQIQVICDDDTNKKKRRGKFSEKMIIPHIVIGTPALIHSQVKSGQLKLDRIKHLVIDKCDRITGDFSESNLRSLKFYNYFISEQRTLVNAICKSIPQMKQIMMFSSVLHVNLERSCQKFIRNGSFD